MNFLSHTKFKNLIHRLSKNKIPTEHPKAFVLGGQPGAGKSRLTRFLEENLDKNIIVLNGDEFRPLHPDAQDFQKQYQEKWVEHTGDFSGKLTEDLIEYFSDQKYNLLIEGTLRTSSVPEKTAQLLRDKNYEVSLCMMCVKPEISYLSTLARYCHSIVSKDLFPRATPKEHHDKVVQLIPENLNTLWDNKVFSQIQGYTRQLQLLFDQRKHPEASPGKVMHEFYNQAYSPQEIAEFKETKAHLLHLLQDPDLQIKFPQLPEEMKKEIQSLEEKIVHTSFSLKDLSFKMNQENEFNWNDEPER